MTRRPDSTRSVFFRVDSSIRLGSGHVMRCLTLANELRRRGATVTFICREHPGHMIDRIEREDYLVRSLPSDGALDASTDKQPGAAGGMEGALQRDLAQTLSVLDATRPQLIVKDHYSLDARWEAGVRAATRKLLVIEDLPDHTHECDVLLDQNWDGEDDATRYRARVPAECLCLVGPRFALLQPQYAPLRSTLAQRGDAIRRVLLFFGASDPTDETGKAIEALLSPEFADLEIDVVIGANYPRRAALLAKLESRPGATLHEDVASLAGLIARADLGLGAGGSTMWERLCLGLPSVVTTIAANQERGARALARSNRVIWLGKSTETRAESYRLAVRRAITDMATSKSEMAAPLVDGFGTKRVAEILLPSGRDTLNLRPAAAHDAQLIFDWRNEPLARAMSFSTEPVTWAQHLQWFQARIANRDTTLCVAEADGLPIGQLRLDFQGDEAVLSYSMDRLVRGRGWSKWMISAAMERVGETRRATIRALVKAENAASRRTFASLGWLESPSAESDEVEFQKVAEPRGAPR